MAGGKEDKTTGTSCCQKVKDFLSLVPKGATPPDWSFLWLIFVSLFSSAFTLTFLFPFLPEMVKSFGYTEQEKGTYVGLIASSVFAGRAVGSFFWGWLSDLKGRRLVLLVTILLNGVFSFGFGFVNSLPAAMMLRFLAGLANGTVGVAKTVLYEVSDNTNQAFHMSIISIAWGSGLILGPTVGGYLALPTDKYPGVFGHDGFFADYPFVLPSLCCLVVCGVVFIIVFFKFSDPKLVLNTLDTEFNVEEEPLNPAEGDETKQGTTVSLRMEEDAATREDNNGTATKAASHAALLHTAAARSSSERLKLGMSRETLRCDTELMYYYAQLQSKKHRHPQPHHHHHHSSSPSDNPVSKSMHNLSPRVQGPWDCNEDEFLQRKRTYSHGDQTLSSSSSPRRPKAVSETDVGYAVNGTGATLEEDAESPAVCVEGGIKLMTEKEEEREGGGGGGGREKVEEEGRRSSVWRSCWSSVRNSSLVRVLRIRDVQHSVALYSTMSFAIIGYEDVFTIFASTSQEFDGLAFSTDEIGLALGAVSIPLMFIQIKVYPMLVARVGIKRAYLINTFFMFIPVQLLPMIHLLVNQVWLWVCLLAVTLPLRVAANSCFAGSSLLINNSVTSDMAGKVNGIGMTATAIARTLAPTLGGALFSWSIKMCQLYGSPLDINLSFFFFGFVLFISALQCLWLPEHLDHQKK